MVGVGLFTWDETKNEINARQHGISFESACLVFDDPLHISRQDRIENAEQRWQTLGMAGGYFCCWWRMPGTKPKPVKNTYALFLRGVQPDLKGKSMKKIPESVRKELAAVAAKPESEIDFSDIPATSEGDWNSAAIRKFYRPAKKQLTVRIDADVLEWLKNEGAGYQSRLNSILRLAMLNNAKRHQSGKWIRRVLHIPVKPATRSN